MGQVHQENDEEWRARWERTHVAKRMEIAALSHIPQQPLTDISLQNKTTQKHILDHFTEKQ